MNLNIISYNVKGFKPRNYDYLEYLFNRTDILLIQESWLYEHEHDKVSNILRNSCCLGVSAMRNDEIGHIGRPFGGCLILYKRTIKLPIYPINTSSDRICAAKIDTESVKILLISIYMPCTDNSTDSCSQYDDVLAELSAVIQIYDDFNIIIGGDFNVDFNKINSNRNKLLNFLASESLINVGAFFNNFNYTFESSNGHRSCIDHFISSENAINSISGYEVLYDGTNLSDHYPIRIVVKSKMSFHNDEIKNVKEISNSVNWNKADEHDVDNYKSCLDEFLSCLQIPENVVHCNDFNCDSHDHGAIAKYLDILVDIMLLSARMTIPSDNDNNNKTSKSGKLGWNKYVKDKRDSAILWHKIWKEAGSPTYGQLFEIRKYTRKCYHNAIMYIKNNTDKILREKIAQSLANNNVKNFWNEIRKIKATKNNSTSIIDNVVGGDNIASLFKVKYEKLYNEFDNNNLDFDFISNLIVDKCKKNICFNSHDINGENVCKAIKKLKINKNDPIYQISSEYIIKGSHLLHSFIAKIFNCFFKHGISYEKFNKSVIIPIIKDKRKSINDSSNYRAITLSSIITKLFEYIILEKLENQVLLNVNQFGYKKNMSTTTCSFILNQTIQYYKRNGSNVYCLFLDASKAFDRVCHEKLFKCLINNKVCPLIIRIIAKMYELNSALIKWNSSLSEKFNISNGVKQGAILSPYLFAIYLNPLLNDINKSKYGCFIGGQPCNILAYADDLVILSPTLKGLSFLFDLTTKFSKEFQLNFNKEKSFIIMYSDIIKDSKDYLVINNDRFEVKNCGKHLGFEINNNANLYNFTYIKNDMCVKTNVLRSTFYFLDFETKIKLFNSHCLSLYGCELWNLNDDEISKLQLTWRKCIKKLLNLPMRCRSKLIPEIIINKDILTIIQNRMLNFYIKGIAHCDPEISTIFKNSLLTNCSFSTKNLNIILNQFKIPYFDLFLCKKKKLNSVKCNERWRIDLIRELCIMREQRDFQILSMEEINFIINVISII